MPTCLILRDRYHGGMLSQENIVNYGWPNDIIYNSAHILLPGVHAVSFHGCDPVHVN